jgi:hypothetical protein
VSTAPGSFRLTAIALVSALACSPPSLRRVPPPDLGFTQATLPAPALENSADPAEEPAPAEPAPQAGELAWLEPGSDAIAVRGSLPLHPEHELPPPATRRVLDAVAGLLRQRPDILLVRIEGYSSSPPGEVPARVRQQIEGSQARADAVLRYLWQSGGISAERLEAIGFGYHPERASQTARWPIAFRVVQWQDERE